ncbi:MAG: FAD-binding oxidoreductase [Nitriliruptor sp.]|nr:MAG: FAD-binding oxidoreductase [Nitriliruptor sp.]
MSSPFTELRRHHTGPVVLPGDPDWDDARRAWNLLGDHHPAAVALCGSADDVRAVVAVANEHDLRVSVQSTGHNATSAGRLTDTVLVKTSPMRGVSIDAVARRARAEGGVIWQEVTEAAAPHGLAALAGSAPDVGVVGYTLGGGLSWMARRYGLAANHVTALEVVTGDGRALRVDHDQDPELFWALRGGGGGLAIVTAIEFALVPVAEVVAGAMFWPWERAEEVLETWRQATTELPETVDSLAALAQMPPIPDIPEPFRGRSFAVVMAAASDGEASLAPLLEPLRGLTPEIDMFAPMPASALGQLKQDPEEPVPATGGSVLLTDATPETITELVRVAGPGSGSPLLSVELRHLGGALARRPEDAGVVGAIDGGYLAFGVGMPMDPDGAAAIDAHVATMTDALAQWKAGRSVMNFTEHSTDPRAFFDPGEYDRLVAAKRRYDPDDRVVASHPMIS